MSVVGGNIVGNMFDPCWGAAQPARRATRSNIVTKGGVTMYFMKDSTQIEYFIFSHCTIIDPVKLPLRLRMGNNFSVGVTILYEDEIRSNAGNKESQSRE